MSILNGKVGYVALNPAEPPYGQCLSPLRVLPSDGVMDVFALDNDTLLTAGNGFVSLWNVDEAGETLLSVCSGLGAARQVSCWGGFAYMTARAGGIYVIDVRDRLHPKLVDHLDSLELATGVCVADGLLAVTNRHMGVELWDVREPARPAYLSDFRCGEAQSVWLYGLTAVIGDWMNRQVRLFDISDPRHPAFLTTYPVDGFADGVCVVPHDGGWLGLCATGHHAARLKNRLKYQRYDVVVPEMFADGYGCGHGLELFDLASPRDPEYLATLKTPPHFGGIDSWRVFSDGSTAFLTDSVGGLFAVDIRDPASPSFLWHYRVPTRKPPEKAVPPLIQSPAEPVMGVALLHGRVYAALPQSGVHVLEPPKAPGRMISSTVTVTIPRDPEASEDGSFLHTKGQLHSFAIVGDVLYAASGEVGVEAFSVTTGELLHTWPAKGICHDLLIFNGFLLTAEGDAGVACYRFSPDALTELSRVQASPKDCVRQLVTVNGRIAVELGSGKLACLSLDSTGILSMIGAPVPAGLLYHRHLSRTTAFGCLVTNPLNEGPRLYRVTSTGFEEIAKAHSVQECPIEDGACGDGGDGLFRVFRRQYAFLPSSTHLGNEDFITVPGASLRGEPFFYDPWLILLERATGTVELLDVTDRNHPVFVWRTSVPGAPECVQVINNSLYIACGRKGLLKLPLDPEYRK